MRFLLTIWIFVFVSHTSVSAQFVGKHYEAQQLQLQAGFLFEELQKDLSDGWRPDVDLYIFKEGGFNLPVVEVTIAGQPDTLRKEGGSLHVTYKNYVTMWMFDKPMEEKLKNLLVSSLGDESWVEFYETKSCMICVAPTELGSAKKDDEDVKALKALLKSFLKRNNDKL